MRFTKDSQFTSILIHTSLQRGDMALYSSTASRFNGFLSESIETLIIEPSAGDTSLKRGVNEK